MNSAGAVLLDPRDWSPPQMPTGAIFDPARALKAQWFFEEKLVHTKGRWARKPFLLRDWQLHELIWPLFGVLRHDPQLDELVRQYALAWIELARKNGKSEILAGICLYMTIADGEEGAEVYGAAQKMGKGENAGAAIVFRVAKRMCDLSPWLSAQRRAGRLRIYERDMRIVWRPTESFYQVIPADAAAALGLNPHCVAFDEVLTQKERDFWDNLKTGQGARTQSLHIGATTAGSDALGLASEEHLWSEQVLRNPDLDPARLVFMRNMPRDADWRDESNWSWPNPALGDFLSRATLQQEAKEAEGSPSKVLRWRQFHGNQWVRRSTKWLDMDGWDECVGDVDWHDLPRFLEGQVCWGGIDLASTADFTVYALIFGDRLPNLDDEDEDDDEIRDDVDDGELAPPPPLTYVVPRFFLPRAAVEKRAPMRPQLDAWADQGALTVTDGRVFDEDALIGQLGADISDYQWEVQIMRYDQWNASTTIRKLEDAGVECEGIAQTTSKLSAPSKELELLLGRRLFRHGGHPVLDWMAGNAECFTDGSGNIKPDRKNSAEKIDGVVATVEGLAGRADAPARSFAVAGW